MTDDRTLRSPDAASPGADRALTPPLSTSPLRAAVRAATRPPEPDLLPALVEQATLAPDEADAAGRLALRLAAGVRERTRGGGRAGLVQGLLQEFALSSQEGVALMCLAEALLRIPDPATRDALIRDKIGSSDWRRHLGRSPSLFVNAATWGLLVTGQLVATHSDAGLTAALRRIVGRGGEPLIRKGVDLAMRLMGEQFVTGQTIDEALANARPREAQGFRYSYDMLGEAAMTAADAAAYGRAYETAIDAIGAAAAGRGIHAGPGISIKLSALHPRYARAQVERVKAELLPRLVALAQRAKRHDIGLNIDAEEADRLDLSLDLLEALCAEPSLAGWNGIGFVIQAYQKRCPAVIDVVVDLARRSGRRLMVRLVKGAYWDSEIKRAQVDGLSGYPVYTRKAYTDVAYIACARRLLAAPDAVYPQFATHNAHTLAAVHRLALAQGLGDVPHAYEFQCLHGMGEPLYEQVVAPPAQGGLGRACRIYAPVGTHETLLAYLVRRLLENGANTSFVNRIASDDVPLAELVEDPVVTVRRMAERDGALGRPHPAIPLPRDLYGSARPNSRGIDLADEATLAALSQALADSRATAQRSGPTAVDGDGRDPGAGRDADDRSGGDAGDESGSDTGEPLRNPADRADVVGRVREATRADVDAAVAAAERAAPGWAATPPAERARRLDDAAERLEAQTLPLIALLVREAGKTAANGIAEVREAIDFLRYCAQQVRDGFDAATHRPLGPVVCISPWNFPLAIFTGQVAAALAAGNPVLAKPAEQTPLVAAAAVRALHDAGVPRDVLQLLPGRGETVGAPLVADARVQGVLFTGSTEVARLLQKTLAGRIGAHGEPVPLVAETGGQNAMVVDSSALAEQVVADVLTSAFDSAGQRCSALRVLCVQRDGADRLIAMLEGAVRELRVGDPARLAVDVGPVIDADAKATIDRHVAAMRERGRRVVQPAPLPDDVAAGGSFVPPTLIAIDAIADLEREVFGPVLHVLRYDRDALPELLEQIAGTGYGLTMGVHTRIDETLAQVVLSAHAGNVYANRNIVGAVVGVQPFGGEGLSGTGPKAGGPLYLLRLLAERPGDAALRAIAGSGEPGRPPVRGWAAAAARMQAAEAADAASRPGAAGRVDRGGDGRNGAGGGRDVDPDRDPDGAAALAALRDAARSRRDDALASTCERLAALAPPPTWRRLTGPTGEANLYAVLPRDAVLCLAPDGDEGDADRLRQLAAVLAVGSRAVWPAVHRAAWQRLPAAARERVVLADDWGADAVAFDAVLHHGSRESLLDVQRRVAARPGPVVGITALPPGRDAIPLERLLVERSLSINTAAAGGNASLMTIG